MPFSETLKLMKLRDENGTVSLSFDADFPFRVREVFQLYDIPVESDHNLPGNRLTHRFVIAVTGVAYVTVKEGCYTLLDKPSESLCPAGEECFLCS